MASDAEPPTKKPRHGKEAQQAMLDKIIVLVGMRAAGKSTFGKSAAEHFGCPFLDMDAVLEEKIFGCKVGEFVDQNGWPKFRAAELKLLEDILLRREYLSAGVGHVVATGGGVIETPAAYELLKKHAAVIWIDRHVDDICECLEGDGSWRPGLGTPPREIYARRHPLYEGCSDFVMTMRRGAANWRMLEQRFVHLVACVNRGGTDPVMANTICVPITAGTTEAARADIVEAAAEGAGLVELRVDKLEGGVEVVRRALPELFRVAWRYGLPVLCTFRPKWEDPGSSFVGEEKPRLEMQRLAAELGATFIDVEHKAIPAFLEVGGMPPTSKTRLVVSSHDFSCLWEMEELRSLAKEMRGEAGPNGVVKIAQLGSSSAAAARMLVLLEEAGLGNAVSLAMGPSGVYTRLLAPHYGAAFTFGCLPGRASAPGQPSVAEMIETYRLGSVTASTKVFGQLGAPAADVKTAAMFNAGFQAEGWDALYVPMPLHGCSLKELLASLPRQLAGGSVVEEHGRAAAEIAVERDAASAKSGAASVLLATASGNRYMAKSTRMEGGEPIASTLADYALFRESEASVAVEEAIRKSAAKLSV